jgi:hypothetical protein
VKETLFGCVGFHSSTQPTDPCGEIPPNPYSLSPDFLRKSHVHHLTVHYDGVGESSQVELSMKWLKRHLSNIAIVAVVIVGVRFEQDLRDWGKLLGYEAPPQVDKLATTTTMTDTARRLFYLNEPTIESHKSSQNLCKSTEHTVVLGCYVPGKGIFLQEVTDPRLQGVMEVTAAHEMLHAAYGRMSLLEQSQLNERLQATLQQIQNPRIMQLVETYREQEPNSVDNELHSILGTEVRNLSPELEEHYRKYFTERSSIVALSERYEGIFTTLRDKAKQIARQLVTLKSTIDSLEAQVKSEEASISSDRSTIESQRAANPEGDYSSSIASFNNRVQSFQALVTRFNEQTNLYNQHLAAYKSLALEEKSLVESLQNKTSQQSTR